MLHSVGAQLAEDQGSDCRPIASGPNLDCYRSRQGSQRKAFAPQLDPCVGCGEPLADDEMGRFDFASGGIRCARCAADAAGPRVGPVARAQIANLLAGRLDVEFTYARRHLAILSDFVAYHVVSKPLKSLSFLGRLLPPDEEGAGTVSVRLPDA